MLAAALVALSIPTAEAQVGYFTGDERLVAGSGFVQKGENLDGTGFEVEIVPTSRLALAFGYGSSNSDVLVSRPPRLGAGEITTWIAALMAYPRRQGVDGTVTIGVGFSGGVTTTEATLVELDMTQHFSDDLIALGVNTLVVTLITEPNRPFRVIARGEAGVSVLLTNAKPTVVQTLGVGGGVGFAIGRRVLVALEPSALLSISSGEVAGSFVGTLGLAYAF